MTGRRWDLALCVVTLAIAAALKRHYSVAGAEDLRWILAPTTWLVEQLTGVAFAAEQHVGYFSSEIRYAIAAPCAGINFLIIAICSMMFGFIHTITRPLAKLAFFGGSIALCYLATLAVNTARITIAMALHQSHVTLGWLDAARIHRIEGIVVYLGALLLLYLGFAAVLKPGRALA